MNRRQRTFVTIVGEKACPKGWNCNTLGMPGVYCPDCGRNPTRDETWLLTPDPEIVALEEVVQAALRIRSTFDATDDLEPLTRALGRLEAIREESGWQTWVGEEAAEIRVPRGGDHPRAKDGPTDDPRESARVGSSAASSPSHVCNPPPAPALMAPGRPDWECGFCGRVFRDSITGSFRYWAEVRGPRAEHLDEAPYPEPVRVLLLLAQMEEGDTPVVIGAVDKTIWEHWSDEDDEAWRAEALSRWGLGESEFREAWVEFDEAELRALFVRPVVKGHVVEEGT